jgi:hypothetical protein
MRNPELPRGGWRGNRQRGKTSLMKPKLLYLRFEPESAMKRFRRFVRKIVGYPKDELKAQLVRYSKQREALKKAEKGARGAAPED